MSSEVKVKTEPKKPTAATVAKRKAKKVRSAARARNRRKAKDFVRGSDWYKGSNNPHCKPEDAKPNAASLHVRELIEQHGKLISLTAEDMGK